MRFLFVLATLICPMIAGAQSAPTLAEDGLSARIEFLQRDPAQHSLELGFLTGLRGLENVLQARHRYGLGDEFSVLGILPTPPTGAGIKLRDAPKTVWRDLYRQLDTDMDAVRDALAVAPPVPFRLTLQDIWLDVDGDGARQDTESATQLLGATLFSRRQLREIGESGGGGPITIRFDESDADWLLAYTHILSSLASFALAFDPTDVLADLKRQSEVMANRPAIANIYDQDQLKSEIAALIERRDQLQVQIDRAKDIENDKRKASNEARQALSDNSDPALADALKAAVAKARKESSEATNKRWELSRAQRNLRNEISAAESKLSNPEQPNTTGRINTFRFLTTADAIYVSLAALRQAPDTRHIENLRGHLRLVIQHNRAFWNKVNAETDNDSEWIPNPNQTSGLGLEFPDETGPAWLAVLEDAEHVIEGRLLVPHPLMPPGTGIDVSKYFDDPSNLDLLEWVHGIAAYRYAAKGPMITQQRWLAFSRIVDGRGGMFAIVLN